MAKQMLVVDEDQWKSAKDDNLKLIVRPGRQEIRYGHPIKLVLRNGVPYRDHHDMQVARVRYMPLAGISEEDAKLLGYEGVAQLVEECEKVGIKAGVTYTLVNLAPLPKRIDAASGFGAPVDTGPVDLSKVLAGAMRDEAFDNPHHGHEPEVLTTSATPEEQAARAP